MDVKKKEKPLKMKDNSDSTTDIKFIVLFKDLYRSSYKKKKK